MQLPDLTDEDFKRWPNFSRKEFACACCGKAPMDPAFMDILQLLRIDYGKPMVISSGYRCAAHNQKVSSTGPNGPHTTGQAADVAVARGDAYELLQLGIRIFTGIGVNQKGAGRFLHFDTIPNSASAPRPTLWSY